MTAALVAFCGFLALVTAWQTLVLWLAGRAAGRHGPPDYYRWGWRHWKARAARGLNTNGPGIYIQLTWLPIAVYIGQTINARQRFTAEGRDIMALAFAWGIFIPADETDLDELERWLIRWLPWCRALGFNRTRGGS